MVDGHRPPVERLLQQAKDRKFEFKILDERKFEDLDPDLLAGMMVEIRLPLGPTLPTNNHGGSQ